MEELGDNATPNQHHGARKGHEDQENPKDPGDSEDGNYIPLSEEEDNLGPKDFIIHEDPLDQERIKRQLIATVRSLKKKQHQLKAEHNAINDRWTKVLAAEHGFRNRGQDQNKSYPWRRLLLQFNYEALEPIPPRRTQTN